MSEENLEVVRREYAALDARDWTAFTEIWHPDIEYETLETDPDSGTYRGLDEITRLFDSHSAPYAEYRVQAEEILDVGPDQVLTVERNAGQGLRGSDAAPWIEHVWFRLITFKDGRIWRNKEYASRKEALEAAGLRE